MGKYSVFLPFKIIQRCENKILSLLYTKYFLIHASKFVFDPAFQKGFVVWCLFHISLPNFDMSDTVHHFDPTSFRSYNLLASGFSLLLFLGH